MPKYTREQLSEAYDLGWDDGYNDEMYCNPYDLNTQEDLWFRYDMGFSDGSRES